MEEHFEELCELCTQEHGKTYDESKGDVFLARSTGTLRTDALYFRRRTVLRTARVNIIHHLRR